MKKVTLLATLILFSGCSQLDGVYGVGKTIAPHVPMPTETRVILETYDDIRSEVRELQELKKTNASTSEVLNPL